MPPIANRAWCLAWYRVQAHERSTSARLGLRSPLLVEGSHDPLMSPIQFINHTERRLDRGYDPSGLKRA